MSEWQQYVESMQESSPAAAELLAAMAERHDDLAPVVAMVAVAHDAIVEVVRAGGTLYVCGNGGSFADAVHIKGELGKSFMLKRPIIEEDVLERLATLPMGESLTAGIEVGVPVIVLGESLGQATAYANDREPVLVMAQDLMGHVCRRARPGVLVGLSTSGNSANVIAAMSLAQAYDVMTVSMTGPDGGKMAELADIAIKAPGGNTPEVQESHVRIYHALCLMIEATLFG